MALATGPNDEDKEGLSVTCLKEDSLTQEDEDIRSFETSGTTKPAMQCHITEDWDPLKQALNSSKDLLLCILKHF